MIKPPISLPTYRFHNSFLFSDYAVARYIDVRIPNPEGYRHRIVNIHAPYVQQSLFLSGNPLFGHMQ